MSTSNPTTGDEFWSELAATWKRGDQASTTAVGEALESLQSRASAQRRRMIAIAVVEVLITVTAIVAIAVALLRFPSPLNVLRSIDTAVFLVATWTFGAYNRRGTWAALGDSVDDFLALMRLRCVRRLRAARFTVVAVLAQVAFVLAIFRYPSFAERLGVTASEDAGAWLVTLLCVAAFLGGAEWVRRRARRELAELDDLRRRLFDEDSA